MVMKNEHAKYERQDAIQNLHDVLDQTFNSDFYLHVGTKLHTFEFEIIELKLLFVLY